MKHYDIRNIHNISRPPYGVFYNLKKEREEQKQVEFEFEKGEKRIEIKVEF